jgi:MFS family permease
MTLTWIAAISLGGLVLALILAPALDVRLSRRVANPIVVGALLLALALAISNGIAFTVDDDAIQVLGVISGVLVAAGLFVVALAAARFAAGDEVGSIAGMTTARTSTPEERAGLV